MTAREPPSRHWHIYGTQPLPEAAEALQQPLSAFPSWFLRITCDRCGKDRMVNEAHAPWRNRALFDIMRRLRHDGCGGLAGKAELLTGIEAASSRPVRRIVLLGVAVLVVGLLAAGFASSALADSVTSRPGPFDGWRTYSGTDQVVTGTSRPGAFSGYRETDITRGGVTTHCSTRPGAFKGEKVQITLLMPPRMLEQVDEVATRRGISRSG